MLELAITDSVYFLKFLQQGFSPNLLYSLELQSVFYLGLVGSWKQWLKLFSLDFICRLRFMPY